MKSAATRQRRPGDVVHERGTTCSEEWTERKPLSTWAELSSARQALEGASLAPGTEATLESLRDPRKRPSVPLRPVPDELVPPQATVDVQVGCNTVRTQSQVGEARSGRWAIWHDRRTPPAPVGCPKGSATVRPRCREVVEGPSPSIHPRSHPFGKINRAPKSRRGASGGLSQKTLSGG